MGGAAAVGSGAETADAEAAGARSRAGAVARIRAELAAGELELPLLPNVAAEVVASSVDDRADAARLAALIQQDQSLATHVLRVVNSPAFRGVQEIVALQQAIARLGMTRIREIAVSASLKAALLRPGPYQSEADSIWRESLAAGLWAREIARQLRHNVEIAYLCGLLHDIGAPVVLHRLGQIAPGLDPATVTGVREATAAAAGAALARAWALPVPVTAAIAHWRTLDGAAEHADMISLTAAGAALGRRLQTSSVLAIDIATQPWATRLNLYPDDLDTLLERQQQIADTVMAMVL